MRRAYRHNDTVAHRDLAEDERKQKLERKQARKRRRLEEQEGGHAGRASSPSPCEPGPPSLPHLVAPAEDASVVPAMSSEEERASMQLAAQLAAEDSGRGRSARKRARPEVFNYDERLDQQAGAHFEQEGATQESVATNDFEQPDDEGDEDAALVRSSEEESSDASGASWRHSPAKHRRRDAADGGGAVASELLTDLEVDAAIAEVVDEDEDIDEDEYFMRRYLLEQVSAAVSPPAREKQLGSAASEGEMQSTSDLGSPLPKAVSESVGTGRTPPKPRIKAPRKKRSIRNSVEPDSASTSARVIGVESYREHLKGNVVMRAKARVAGGGADSSSKAAEEKLTSGRENRLKSRGLSSALSRTRNTGSQSEADRALASLNQLKVRKKRLRFERSLIHEWGLFTQESVISGDVVIEYVGEVSLLGLPAHPNQAALLPFRTAQLIQLSACDAGDSIAAERCAREEIRTIRHCANAPALPVAGRSVRSDPGGEYRGHRTCSAWTMTT